MQPIWVGFLAQNFLNKGPIFGRFSLKMDRLSRNWQKSKKMGTAPPNFIIKLGVTASFGN